MSTKSKTLAKSLHTVSVLVCCARIYMHAERYPAKEAIERVLQDLGYLDAADPYDLRGKALTQLQVKRGFDL